MSRASEQRPHASTWTYVCVCARTIIIILWRDACLAAFWRETSGLLFVLRHGTIANSQGLWSVDSSGQSVGEGLCMSKRTVGFCTSKSPEEQRMRCGAASAAQSSVCGADYRLRRRAAFAARSSVCGAEQRLRHRASSVGSSARGANQRRRCGVPHAARGSVLYRFCYDAAPAARSSARSAKQRV